MNSQRFEIAWFQSDFYRNNYHKILRWLIVSVVIMMLLIFSIIYLILTQSSAPYYGTTTEGMIIPMVQIR